MQSVISVVIKETIYAKELTIRFCSQEGIQTIGANMVSTFDKLSEDSTVEELTAPAQALMQFISSAREVCQLIS